VRSAYINDLKARFARDEERAEQERAEKEYAHNNAVRERLTPLVERLRRLLDTLPGELQSEGLSLASLQRSLRGRSRENCHPGELGQALRQLGFKRERRWRGTESFKAVWRRQV
jgi:hypothetical protein